MIKDHEPQRHYGNYRGEVIRRDDPLKAGRVKINIFGVYDDIPEDAIPWAIYADPEMGGTSEVGSVIIPEMGAHVWCFFEGGDHHYPVFWAGAPAMKDGVSDLPSESRESGEYPANKVRKTKSGILMEMDDTEGSVRLRFYHPSGTERLVDNDGNEVVNVTGDQTDIVNGSQSETVEGSKTSSVSGSYEQSASAVTINSDGTVEIAAGGNVNITGAFINLN